MGKLDGKVAAITGGTRGIGRGIAEAFIAEGAAVVINGRTPEKGEQALAEMDAGDQAVFYAGDVVDQSVCEGLVAETVSQFGKIDIMVPNTGGGRPGMLVDLSDEDWQYVLDWNLNHTMWCMRAALRDMLPRKWGRIINVSSMYGKLPVPGVSTYATTKAAINGLTRVVAHEVGAEGVTVNALCPGFVETDNLLDNGPGAAEANGMTYEAWLEVVLAPSAIKRMNTVEECGAMAVLLASEEGGGITGTSINIDGGTSPY